MKKAVMQFTACCLAAGMTVSSFGAVALADNNSSMTLAGLSEKSTVVTSTTLAGLSEANTVVVSGGAESTAAEEETAEETSEDAETIEGTEVLAEAEAADTETVSEDTAVAEDAESGSDTTDTGNESDAEETTDASDSETDTDASDSTTTDASDADEAGTLAGVSGTDAVEEAETETETETELVYDSSMNGELAFAQCENYINVRTDASADSEVVGKVYNNGSVTILGQLGDWYEVQSGNVTGYVNAEYFATGEAAEEIANSVAYNVATVNAEGLWIHSDASEDSETIGMAYSSDQLEVVSYEGDWMKVVTSDGTYGYINAWYVDYDTYYSTAETLEEEQERLDQEWLAYLAEQEAEQAAAEAAAAAAAAEAEAAAAAQTEATYTYTETEATYDTYTSTTTTDVDAAYQAYLEAQEAADAATHQADEQLVYDTYDAAVAAYQDYLDAVNAANAASAAQTEATYTETESTYTETEATYVETEATYTETEATYTETEATYTETEAATTSSSSSTGQSIANYAVQFVGNPYVYGGTSLTNGADCSGFTQSVFANFGISIPRTAAAQASSGTSVSLSDIQAGDLLFYSDGGGISHVALYIGGGQVVHASTSSTGIIISSYNYRTPVCARRYWS